MTEIVWRGTPQPWLNEEIREGLEKVGFGPEVDPADLICHVHQMTDDIEGPSVTVWGEVGCEHFWAEYAEKTEWAPLIAEQQETE